MNRRSTIAMLLTASTAAGATPRPTPAAPAPRRGPFVEARDGTRLFWRSWGEGSTTILFDAAWALPSQAWQYQMARLSQAGCRCIAFDRRGHGRSDDPGA